MRRTISTLVLVLIHSVALGHGHEHDTESESSANTGPEKGILEASEVKGFRLSAEAVKNFGIATQKLKGDGPWTLPKSAVVRSGEEVNFFRLRSGFFKRIDFTTIKKTSAEVTADSDSLRGGDEIVVTGTGFLRIAELSAFGDAVQGHSH